MIEVGDGVVVGVGYVILSPVTLNDAAGVFFIVITFWSIFYCPNMTEQ